MVNSANTRGGKTWVYWKHIFKKWIKSIKHKINPYFSVRCNGLFQNSLKMLKNLETRQAKTPTTKSIRDKSDDVKQARLHVGTFPFLKP